MGVGLNRIRTGPVVVENGPDRPGCVVRCVRYRGGEVECFGRECYRRFGVRWAVEGECVFVVRGGHRN